MSQLGAIPVVWARFPGQAVYPHCVLQVVTGPISTRDQRSTVQNRQVEWTISAGAASAPVAALIGGRVISLAHTGNATTTATAAGALMPAHWTVVRVGAVLTITGEDVFGGFAYEGSTLTAVVTGPLFKAEFMRREVLIQCAIWNRDDATGRPARWDALGCDALALKVQNALRQIEPDPYRVYIAPQSNIRPFDESFGDGRNYTAALFDTRVSWLDLVSITKYGATTEFIKSMDLTVEASDGVATHTEAISVAAP